MKYALAVVLLIVSAPAAAQTDPNPKRLPWFVVDAHGATVGLPQAEGWVPPGTAATTTVSATGLRTTTPTVTLPGRHWGMAGGATVYPFRLGGITVGVGASLVRGGRTADTVVITGRAPTAVRRVTQAVNTGITSVMPQLSINFGRKLGWSYVNAGFGRSKVTSRTDPSRVDPAPVTGATPPVPTSPVLPVVVPEAWNQSLHYGGGARWFMKPRLGAGFDVRFITLAARPATDILPAAQRTRVWNISVGISIQ
jgi:hypothetical protein